MVNSTGTGPLTVNFAEVQPHTCFAAALSLLKIRFSLR